MKRYIVQIMFIVFSALLFLNALTSVRTLTIREDLLNQRDYMLIVASLILLISLLSIFFEWRKSRKTNEKDTLPAFHISKKVIIIISATLLFVLGATFIGFFTSTLLFIFAITVYLGELTRKNIVKSASFAVGLTVVLYIVFDIINVYFPNTLLI
ncbi:tripartite tricarboxylate transporter TctB family protein [Alkalicoccobacillus porphyridii]|uniref:DUF1468 domain-containing protein n=1 Tax=Alkalicoccobacillus porphyridii TaxID=2597270 RepID=A0A554A3Y1_9BACI|nr:tripartite tricarboxylate transporter TctB family protein [Alkalicoccobacillus porphyridii]TSB48401.1 hypothetical protein FN960_02275 [Alkalicoccobacillus porphyridii]